MADNILPLSVAGTLPAAFREWRFTGETVDHEVAEEICRLCEQEGLRYHFAIFDEGRELGPEDARKALADRMRQMRLESCLRALERLAMAETNDILSNALAYYRLHKALTPKFANVVFWRLQANRIDHDPGFFKVRLDKASFVEDLRAMPPRNVQWIWKALTSS